MNSISNSPDSSFNIDNTVDTSFSQQCSSSCSISIDSLSAPVMVHIFLLTKFFYFPQKDCLDEKLIQQHMSRLIKQRTSCSSSSLSSSSFICDESFNSSNIRSGAPRRLILSYLSRFRKLHAAKGKN